MRVLEGDCHLCVKTRFLPPVEMTGDVTGKDLAGAQNDRVAQEIRILAPFFLLSFFSSTDLRLLALEQGQQALHLRIDS